MQKLALFLGLALAACSSSSSSADADATDQAVTGVEPPTQKPTEPEPTPPVEPTPPAPPSYAVSSCEDVAKLPARGELDFELRSDSLPKYIDVQAVLEQQQPGPDTTTQFSVSLRFSTVKNWDLYATFGAAVVSDSFAETAAFRKAASPSESWLGDYVGTDSSGGDSQCKDGSAGWSAVLDNFGYAHITITSKTDTMIEGTWERGHTSQDGATLGAPYEKGHFKAPIVERPGAVGFKHHPVKTLCCAVP